MTYFDNKETRSADQRANEYDKAFPTLFKLAVTKSRGYAAHYQDLDLNDISSTADLIKLPVLRKSQIQQYQASDLPYGGFTILEPNEMDYIFQSPGPIYEPGSGKKDWWRIARFLFACGISNKDIVQNCFSYHLTPAGHIFESGAKALGTTIVPAGTGNTELQVQIAKNAGVTAYAGTPDYLKIILDKAQEMGIELPKISKAGVGGGPLFPTLRQEYNDRGISCLQNYATAEAGNIAYETIADQGMIVDEDVIVEIVRPGSGTPVENGEIGEVLVTVFNPDFPLIRFATGDLSSFMAGQSACGRTNARISGWKGRADQTTKVKGMFVRPEQMEEFLRRNQEVYKVRAIVTRRNESDLFAVQVETASTNTEKFQHSLREILNLRAEIELVAKGSLPNDGKVIDDQREFG